MLNWVLLDLRPRAVRCTGLRPVASGGNSRAASTFKAISRDSLLTMYRQDPGGRPQPSSPPRRKPAPGWLVLCKPSVHRHGLTLICRVIDSQSFTLPQPLAHSLALGCQRHERCSARGEQAIPHGGLSRDRFRWLPNRSSRHRDQECISALSWCGSGPILATDDGTPWTCTGTSDSVQPGTRVI